MSEGVLWLVPALPLAGFAILAIAGGRLSRRAMAVTATGAVGLSALVAFGLILAYLLQPPADGAIAQTLWRWVSAGALSADIGLRMDALALVMVGVITGVGFLIHLYSMTFMAGDRGYRRYFAYLNLFVFGMLTLVLADNLLLLYLGWEMVGLCSYLLIGHGYEDPDNGRAARKAFIVTRIGDAAMIVGLFLLFHAFGTLHLPTLLAQAEASWSTGEPLAIAASALLLAGAVGKSAQLPLQVWLPDAMAGPTPVSALIHAATMVTAGVYLIARTHVLFELAPVMQGVVAAVGALTLLLAAFSALTQRDIKRVLAYSTISQIGYMVLALGVGAYAAGMLHFMTHAFFKALLFLAAGVVIHALHDEHDIFRMGGLWHRLPGTSLAFLIGAASLAAVPLVTAGFYSKDLILWYAYASPDGGWLLWLAAEIGSFLTGFYIFRVVFVAFTGPETAAPVERGPRTPEIITLAALSVLALVGGFVEIPQPLGSFQPFAELMHEALPSAEVRDGLAMSETLAMIVSALVAFAGIALAWLRYGQRRAAEQAPGDVRRFWQAGWGFDWLYGHALVTPFLTLTHANRRDFIDSFYSGVAATADGLHRLLSKTQTGRLRWYAAGIAGGTVVLLAILVLP